MRKILMTFFVVLLSVVMVYTYADAAINKPCSSCHTMHNSENGGVVDASGPNQQLIKYGCVGCHTTTSGPKNASSDAPAVLHTSDPSGQGYQKTNAGGDFYWAQSEVHKGHNVEGIGSAAITEPPGWDQKATEGVDFDGKDLDVTGGSGWSKQLTCAGTFGCHGTRDGENFVGIRGAHHSNDNGTETQASTPTTVAGSYRFLAGIKGLENGEWNWNEGLTSHNEYYGVDSPASRKYDADPRTYTNKDTISYLCAECHGVFHSAIADDTGGGSPWRRHPTDIALPNSGEYQYYTAYSLEAPVARSTVPSTASGDVTPGTDVVMCLSCHRAHGSPEDYLLRWSYSNMIAGDNTKTGGCFTCHTQKND